MCFLFTSSQAFWPFPFNKQGLYVFTLVFQHQVFYVKFLGLWQQLLQPVTVVTLFPFQESKETVPKRLICWYFAVIRHRVKLLGEIPKAKRSSANINQLPWNVSGFIKMPTTLHPPNHMETEVWSPYYVWLHYKCFTWLYLKSINI